MKKTIILLAAVAAMTACKKEDIEAPAVGYGYINLGVSADTEIVVTKAETPVYNDYYVSLKQNGTAVSGWPVQYKNITAENRKVIAGTGYSIYVENVSVADAYSGKGMVRVAGESAMQEILAGKTHTFEVNCTPQNSKVSFVYTEKFANVFDEAAATVLLDTEGRNLSMAMQQRAESYVDLDEAYFEPGRTLKWQLSAANLDGQLKTYSGELTTVKAQWSIVKFDAGDKGQIVVTITVDDSIDDKVEIQTPIDPLQ